MYERAAPLAVELLDEVLAGWPDIELRPQPEADVTYAEKIGPADRELDWSRSPEEIVNRVRALSPHIGARGVVGGRVLTVWKARPAGPNAALVEDGVELARGSARGPQEDDGRGVPARPARLSRVEFDTIERRQRRTLRATCTDFRVTMNIGWRTGVAPQPDQRGGLSGGTR